MKGNGKTFIVNYAAADISTFPEVSQPVLAGMWQHSAGATHDLHVRSSACRRLLQVMSDISRCIIHQKSHGNAQNPFDGNACMAKADSSAHAPIQADTIMSLSMSI